MGNHLPKSPLEFCCPRGVHDWRRYEGEDREWDEECALCHAKRLLFPAVHPASVHLDTFAARVEVQP
jgi:hypothetical protein